MIEQVISFLRVVLQAVTYCRIQLQRAVWSPRPRFGRTAAAQVPQLQSEPGSTLGNRGLSTQPKAGVEGDFVREQAPAAAGPEAGPGAVNSELPRVGPEWAASAVQSASGTIRAAWD